jgi:FlaA1/EpsC-like NDP-sugar epimerase
MSGDPSRPRADARRALIVGRGAAGQGLAADVRARGGIVVGFLDDSARHPEVLGTLAEVNRVIRETGPQVVYFAIPSVDAKTVREFVTSIDVDDVEIAIIPRTYGILAKDTVDIDDLTDVDVLDLVGRQPVKHDLLASREFIKGKTVLVTGAAGSIGSRLVRQLLDMEPAAVIGVDWSESGIFFLGSELGDRAALHLHIADVKNTGALAALFDRYEPHVVFHAAAYKHVPLMQSNPLEAVNNNVGGTLALARLAAQRSVENFVYVSTDKAVNPVNVMGATKRMGELLIEAIAIGSSTRFNAVRFGNVIQSSGSVMQIFRRQIAEKSPLTVTDPEVTRFFMTIDEAAQLVIQSAFVGEPGDLFVLDMGEPVRIMDLAKSLVRAVDPSIEIVITGLRPGEKMFEELSYEPENVRPTKNGKIFVVRDAGSADPSATLSEIESLLSRTKDYSVDGAEVVGDLRAMGFAIQ